MNQQGGELVHLTNIMLTPQFAGVGNKEDLYDICRKIKIYP